MDMHKDIQGDIKFSLHSYYAKHWIVAGTVLTTLTFLTWTILPELHMQFLFSNQNKFQLLFQNRFPFKTNMTLALFWKKHSRVNDKP